ncbi:MAG: glucose starvation-inducible protein B [Thermoproteota archaeon]|nr:glucose starvation-inducible protein B [Thermoproteota archaeon]
MAREGGIAPHNRRGLAAANIETRLRVAKAGGDARSHDRDSLRDAGRKGGESVKAEYGVEFYQTIGEKGGESVKQKYGVDFYREIGEKGGGVVKEKYGPKFYSEIGKRGGEIAREARGIANYSTKGRKDIEHEEKDEVNTDDLNTSSEA